MSEYWRPLAGLGAARPRGAVPLAGGPVWFDRLERLERGRPGEIVSASAAPGAVIETLTAPRPPWAGLALGGPRVMGILNVTPDSFSDGGLFFDRERALEQAMGMIADGADLIDVGGESTRPGAGELPIADELARVMPVLSALAAGEVRGGTRPLSIDTRKAAVAEAALAAGAVAVNDVSALGFDAEMAATVASGGAALALMHAQGSPETMQLDPHYEDVLLDVYDWLAERVAVAETAGTPRSRIAVDPGIGFGKTVAHNLALIRGLSLFHGLGCAVMLGASRKAFIGRIADVPNAAERMPGSLAVALAATTQGVHILRVHDVGATRQALGLWQAIMGESG